MEERNWNKKTDPKRKPPGEFTAELLSAVNYSPEMGAVVEERNWNKTGIGGQNHAGGIKEFSL